MGTEGIDQEKLQQQYQYPKNHLQLIQGPSNQPLPIKHRIPAAAVSKYWVFVLMVLSLWTRTTLASVNQGRSVFGTNKNRIAKAAFQAAKYSTNESTLKANTGVAKQHLLHRHYLHQHHAHSSSVFSRTCCAMSSSNGSNEPSGVTERLLKVPTVPLRNGMKHPLVGFGTYKVGFIPASASSAQESGTAGPPPEERTARECVGDALKAGYRFLECAAFYGNEEEVGKAIAESGIPREELFLCSKVWTTTIEQGPEAIKSQLQSTLKALQTDYVDLYLIHWPVPGHHVTAYKTLIQLRNEGLIKGIGVSNYAWEDYLELKNDPEISSDDLPLVNQIEINPFLYRAKTIELFRKEGVVMQAYRSLRNGKAMDNPALKSIASQYPLGDGHRSVAQVLGRWCVQHGFAHTPKSVKVERMLENANILDFELTAEHMQQLDSQFTTPDTIKDFVELYRKCVNRDTSKDGSMEGVKMDITVD